MEYLKTIKENKKSLFVFLIGFSICIHSLFVYYFLLILDIESKDHNFNLFLTNIVFLIFIVPIIFNNLTFYYNFMNKNNFDIFNCSDSETNSKFNDMKENINTSIKYETLLLFVLVTNIFIPLVLYLSILQKKQLVV